MTTLNRVEIAGGLVRDPELRALPSGTMVCDFTVAIDEPYWNGQKAEKAIRTHFIRCVAWQELAESVAENYRRGDQVLVLGQLSQEIVETAEGKKDSKTKVVAMKVNGLRRGRREVDDDFTPGEAPPF